MKARLRVRFKIYSEPAFLAKVQAIATSLSSDEGRALFPAPWGDPARHPTLAQLLDAVARHTTCYADATNWGRTEISARNESRKVLTDLLKRLAPVLEAIARHDEGTLSKTGYDLQKRKGPDTTGTLPGPENLRLKHGPASGMVLATVSKLRGAGSYDAWTCTGDPGVPANWLHAITTGTCRNIEIIGLTPGVLYYIRIRGISGTGPGGWSNIESIRAL